MQTITLEIPDVIWKSHDQNISDFKEEFRSVTQQILFFYSYPNLITPNRHQVMKFIWDEAKRKTNLTKHGFDFADAEAVFTGMTYTFGDDRTYYGEDRFITVGMLKGRIVLISHTEDDYEIRIISMRKATKSEQKKYFQGF